MLEVPAKFAEMITEQFKIQCTYAEKGCKEAIPFKVRIMYKFLKKYVYDIALFEFGIDKIYNREKPN